VKSNFFVQRITGIGCDVGRLDDFCCLIDAPLGDNSALMSTSVPPARFSRDEAARATSLGLSETRVRGPLLCPYETQGVDSRTQVTAERTT
jgi:hypothetical protein